MSEWWTYTLSDFLLFSPRTYYRLFEIYNAAIWPAQIAAVALGIAILALLRRGAADGGRWVAGILGAFWLFVAIAFHAHRYATINWAAVYFAWAFGLEGALLLWIGVVRGRLAFDRPYGRTDRAGLWIFLAALIAEPFVAILLGRGGKSAEIFGITPDPTAIATLGILVMAGGRGRWLLLAIPVIWCAISGFTLLAMKSPDAWIPPFAAVLAVTLAIAQTSARSRRPGGSATPTSPS